MEKEKRRCLNCGYQYTTQGQKVACTVRRRELGVPTTCCFNIQTGARSFWVARGKIPIIPYAVETISKEGALMLDLIARIQDTTLDIVGAG